MSFSRFLCAIYCALSIGFVQGAATPVDYTVRNAHGASTADTYRAVRRAISEAAIEKRNVNLKNSTTLDRSWDEAVLLKFEHEQAVQETNSSSLTVSGGIEIVCTKCYIKGVATAELSIDSNFDAGLVVSQTLDEVKGKVENFTEQVDDYFIEYFKEVARDIRKDGLDFEDFAPPTFNYDFGMDIPAIPECNLRFQFDGMELYMLTNIILSAGVTYELNLYSSNSPIGISITEDLQVGVIFAIDLIINVEGEIDISSGFHIQIEDGAAINIGLFADDISDIIFNGAKLEFLPVTVESAGLVFSATLRVGVHAGFNLVTPSFPPITIFDQEIGIPSLGGGIEVGVFANVAEFVTNITYAPEEDCKLKVVQSYQLALGAAAGATIAIDTKTWGPMATLSVPIWNTELAEICAIEKTAEPTPTITPSAQANKRQEGLTTTTITTELTYTGVNCMTPGLVNCPNSAQKTERFVETKTVVTAVPSGVDFTLPASIQDRVVDTVAFGENAVTAPATTGSPVSYVPPPPPKTTDEHGNVVTTEDKDGDGKPDKKKKGGLGRNAIIGLSVGLGVPALFALIGAVVFFIKHRQSHAEREARKPEAQPMVAEPYGEIHGAYSDKPTKPYVGVTEVDSRASP